MPEAYCLSRRLHEEIVAFLVFMRPTPQEATARELLIGYINALVQGRWRGATVSTFGSVAFDLALPGG